VKLPPMKDELIQLRANNKTLRDTIETLENRSAAGFQNLTPRPNFRRILGEK